MARSLIPVVEDLQEGNLTVVAQTLALLDQGTLRWPQFFPRQNVDSVDLREITTLDFRPVSDRREWNSPGRLIHSKTPPTKELSIVPVEGYYKWGEYEMQKMAEPTEGIASNVEAILTRRIPDKVEQIVLANNRRIEVDAFQAWSQGTVTAKNPQTGATSTFSFGFDSSRLQTAGTAWDAGGANAYDNLIDWLDDAVDAIGPIEGVVLRLPLLRAIQADAPDQLGGVPMTRGALPQRVSDDIGFPFSFLLFEDTVDIYTDGGIATTSTNIWPAGYMAAVPAGGIVGRTAFAPVVRAMELARSLPKAGIDTRGMTVYYDEAMTGRELKVEVQCNPITIPNEQKLYSINTLVTS
jgi:hypothetical protein